MKLNRIKIAGAVLGLSFGFSAWAETFLMYVPSQQQYRTLQTAMKFKPMTIGNVQPKVAQSLEHINVFVIESDADLEKFSGQGGILIEKNYRIPAPKVSLSVRMQSQFPGIARAIQRPWGIDAIESEGAWQAGYQGQGVKVMVLDSGIDQDQADLSPNFVEGVNFLSSNTAGLPYPYFDEIGHGTHVSGTIGARGENGGLVGVAPQASLYMGKVCGTSFCEGAAILAGVNYAIDNQMDVVNMSLGGGFPSNIERLTYQRAADAGVIVVAAAGNNGSGRVSFPAGYEHTIAVGAVDQNLVRAEFSQYGANLDVVAPGVGVVSSVPVGTGSQALAQLNGFDIDSAEMQGSAKTGELVTGAIAYAGLGKAEEVANADVNGKIALIKRGEINFSEKAQNAERAGAIGVLIFNNVEGLAPGTLNGEMSIPVLMITLADGESAVAQLEAGQEVAAGLGVVASDYASFDGTSMASPHVAGVVALMKSANPNITFAQVRQALKETATSQGNEVEYGAGVVNAFKATMKAEELMGSQQLSQLVDDTKRVVGL